MNFGVNGQHARSAGPFLAVALFFAGERASSAQPLEQRGPSQALELRWDAPAGCPAASRVRAEVLELAELDAEQSPGLRADAVIRRDGDRWRLELTTQYDGMTGERTLSASSCRAVTDAATLTLALILNPDVELPDERSESTRPTPLHFALSARAGLQAGILKGLGPDFALGAGLAGDGPSVWAYAGFAPARDARVRGSSGPGGRVWSGSAAVLGCWDFLEATPLGPCAGAELVRVAGRGIGVANPEDASAYWSSGLLGLRGGVRLGRTLVLRIAGFAVVPAQRPSLFLEEVGRVVRPDAVGARVHAGADLEFR